MSKIVVANWKMNPASIKEAEKIFKETLKELKNIKNSKVIICPPFPFLFIYKKFKSKKMFLGAQNSSKEAEGAQTGEVSPKMLANMGALYVILGHGECRARGEINKIINEKVLNLLKSRLKPILCVGEGKRDGDGFYLSFVADQIRECLHNVPRSDMKNIIIAYEPIWAIGKNALREATREEYIEMKIYIKKVIADMFGSKVAHDIIILYGGSVNPENAKSFADGNDSDGLLVGRDSINPKKFGAILSSID